MSTGWTLVNWTQPSEPVTVVSSIKPWTFQYSFQGYVTKILAEKLDIFVNNLLSYAKDPRLAPRGGLLFALEQSPFLVVQSVFQEDKYGKQKDRSCGGMAWVRQYETFKFS